MVHPPWRHARLGKVQAPWNPRSGVDHDQRNVGTLDTADPGGDVGGAGGVWGACKNLSMTTFAIFWHLVTTFCHLLPTFSNFWQFLVTFAMFWQLLAHLQILAILGKL